MSLILDSVTYRIRSQVLLDSVSMAARKGEIYGFLGHNGAGKTTALRIALGLLRPRSGKVFIDGVDAARHPREARARSGGMIEVPGFHAELSGFENLRMLSRLRGRSAREARAEARQVLGLVGLERQARKRAGVYSQGMRQRLGIAQALLGRPGTILLDEPMNGLDPDAVQDLRRVLLELAHGEGVAVLLSTHQLAELEGLCDRVGLLREGSLLVESDLETLAAGDGSRLEIRCRDEERAVAVLEHAGLSAEVDGERLRVRSPEIPHEELLERLVLAGARVFSFQKERASLHEIYRRTMDGEGESGSPDSRASSMQLEAYAARETAPERRAPRAGIWRVFRHEFQRTLLTRRAVFLLLLPAFVGALQIFLMHAEREARLNSMAEGNLVSVTQMTAYQAFGHALTLGLPLLAFILLLYATQCVAAEDGRGTLRNLLLTPARRFEIGLGKLLNLLLATVLGYALLVLAGLLTAGHYFAYEGVYEILPNGERYPHVEEDVLKEVLQDLLWRPLPALCAFTGIGFLLSNLLRRAVFAMALGFLAFQALTVGWSVWKQVFEIESYLPSTFLPRGVAGADTSFVKYYLSLTEGANNAILLHDEHVVWTPLAWFGASVTLGLLFFARRTVR